MKTQFTTLTHAGVYIDRNLLNRGLYSTVTPCVLPEGTTIDDLIQQAKMAKDMTGELFVSNGYLDNLNKCQISKITITLDE